MKYIYALVDPRTNRIRYIGQTDSTERRILEHLADKRNTPKVEWLRGLRDSGKQPGLIVLAEVEDDNKAHEVEYSWIYFARYNLWELTNTAAMKTEEYYTLQGYFQKLVVEMERPEGVPDRQYSMSDVKQGLIKNLVLFLNWIPNSMGGVGRLVSNAFNSKGMATVFGLLCYVFYVVTAMSLIKSTAENPRAIDVLAVISMVVGCIVTLVSISYVFSEENGHPSVLWTMGFLFVGLTFIARWFM